MINIVLILTIIAIMLIYGGYKLTLIGYNKYGTLMILVGSFQLISELITIF